jgi:hypothetical protein
MTWTAPSGMTWTAPSSMTCLQEAKKSMTFEKTEKIPLTKKGVSVFLQVLL